MKGKKEINLPKAIVNFEEFAVRRIWDEGNEKWLFSVVDVIVILTNSSRPRKYWNALKTKLKQEGNELSQKLGQLKLEASDGKYYLTDIADTETLFRIIQSIPSSKAEPFKLWLARVGYERLQETVDPELAVNRARDHWQQAGRSSKWIEQRMRGQETRNKLTDYWQENDVKKGVEYATLTDIIHQEWSDLTTRQHKNIKGLKRHNLRDNMTEAELIFTALAELSTTQIAEVDKARGYNQNAQSAERGGRIAGDARQALEKRTGKKIVSGENFLAPKKETKKLK
ncbi:MAG: Bro-N domain-containing protein [Candidatus Vogelbacteria bacterium]|nr:Bro-N domain-containing protein [Candidatus Vogelbacteria bacterium]